MIIIDQEKCDRCGSCAAVCETNCISIYESYIDIERSECINCKKCVWICPVDALRTDNTKDH